MTCIFLDISSGSTLKAFMSMYPRQVHTFESECPTLNYQSFQVPVC